MNEQDWQKLAQRLVVDVASLKAVSEVESSGVFFWDVPGYGRVPPVRLEAHWFGKLTQYKFNASHPHISSKGWNALLAAKTHVGAWDQFTEARVLDESAAIQACSWGGFQIMGFHWSTLKYASPKDMFDAAMTEEGQVDMFSRFVEANPVIHYALREKRWNDFETHYNGGGYGGAYARKIEAAYARHV